MIILGIETSCDETSVSIIKTSKNKIEVLSNIVSSQVELHAKWGGVVPNLAAREHLKNVIPVLKKSLIETSLHEKDIDLISVTQGPGLIPALLVGTNFAKTLSYLWNKPLIGIHHIEGHIYANFIEDKTQKIKQLPFPVLALIVSGGHTQLISMKDHLHYEIIGETQDDAVGEAFDKVARILSLGYPGGPAISQLAEECSSQNTSFDLNLPRPMLNSGDFNFSFSGLKTAVLYATKTFREKNKLSENDKLPKEFVSAMAIEFQQAAIDVLVKKTIKAAKVHNPKTIVLAGGVSANRELRKQLGVTIENDLPNTIYQMPANDYTVDNASMIAAAGYYRWENMNASEKKKALSNWRDLQTDANLKLK
jgi:tRNA N6-adenosine threonylcarbamoyltransferase